MFLLCWHFNLALRGQLIFETLTFCLALGLKEFDILHSILVPSFREQHHISLGEEIFSIGCKLTVEKELFSSRHIATYLKGTKHQQPPSPPWRARLGRVMCSELRNISQVAHSTSGLITSFRLACKLFWGKFLLPLRPCHSELFDS